MLGLLTMKKGYAWDGPSGPTIDTKNFMRGSLVHDALYQLMRNGQLAPQWREGADQELRRICREDGMNRFRAWYVLQGVRKGAGFAARPGTREKSAPRHRFGRGWCAMCRSLDAARSCSGRIRGAGCELWVRSCRMLFRFLPANAGFPGRLRGVRQSRD